MRIAPLIVVLCLLAVAAPTDAFAQCVSCGNPAFAAAGDDLARTLDKKDEAAEVRIRASLGYGWLTSDAYFEGNEETVNFDNFSLTMHLWNVSASVEAPWGTALSAVLPWGYLRNERRFGGGVDKGFGDFELRLRQDVPTFWQGGPNLSVTAGAVAPTGVYVKRESTDATTFDDTGLGGGLGGGFGDGSGWDDTGADSSDGAAQDSSRYLSIGRGVWWALAEVELFGRFVEKLGYYASVKGRVPLGYAPDEFGWGKEVRGSVGLNGVVIPEWLSASLIGEYLWRGRSTEVLYGERKAFLNGGGKFVTIMPTLRLMLGDRFGLSVAGRVPVIRDVVGVQVVANASVWVTFSGQFGVPVGAASATPAAATAHGGRAETPKTKAASAAPATKSDFVDNHATKESLAAAKHTTKVGERTKLKEIAALLVPGKITVVDYWASWCVPCKKLDKVVHAYQANPPKNVVFKRFDATNWTKAEWLRYLPDAPTLPVLDIYGADGRLQARLSGAAAFAFASRLPPVPAPAPAAASSATP